jgi:hypothetical protein
MSNTITLQQVRELAAQLPPHEQLKLAADICEQLSALQCIQTSATAVAEETRQARLQLAEQLLAECEGIEDDSQGDIDTAELVRQVRDARIAAIWQSGV